MNHRLILVNNISNALSLLIYLVIAFMMSPFLVKELGVVFYGIWASVQSAVGYLNLMDMGIQSAVMKYVAQSDGQDDKKTAISNIVVNALAFYSLITMVGSIILCGLFFWGINYLSIAPENVDLVRTLLLILGIDMLLMFPGVTFKGVLTGQHRFYVANVIEITMTIIVAISIVIAIKNDFSLISMALITLIGNVVRYLLMLFAANKVYKLFSFTNGKLDRRIFSSLFRFGLRSFIVMVTDRIYLRSDALIVGYFLSAAWVPFYVIPASLVGYSRNLLWTVTQSFMPLFSSLDGTARGGEIKNLYFQYSRYICLCFFPIIVCLFMYGKPFLNLWMGAEFAEKGGIVVKLMALSLLPAAIQPLSGRLLTGLARQDVLFTASLVTAILFIGFGTIGIVQFGIKGLAGAFLISSFSPVLYILYKTASIVHFMVFDFIKKSVLKPALLASVFGLIVHIAGAEGGLESYASLIVHATAMMSVYVAGAYCFVLNVQEREKITLAVGKYLKKITM